MRRLPKIPLPFQLLVIILFSLFWGDRIPVELKSAALTASLLIKSILMSVLPLVIASCIFYAVVSQKGQGLKRWFSLLFFVCLSTILGTVVAYLAGLWLIAPLGGQSGAGNFLMTTAQTNGLFHAETRVLNAYFVIPPFILIQNQWAVLLGFIGGLLALYGAPETAFKWASHLNHWIIDIFLRRIFAPWIPVLVLGFVLKMQHEELLLKAIAQYGRLLSVLFVLQLSHVLFLFLLVSSFNIRKAWSAFKVALTPALTAFGTMSSVATLPVTLRAAERNTGQPGIASMVIPSTVNIHMVGDAVGIPLMGLAILWQFQQVWPSPMLYAAFIKGYVLNSFAGAAVPAGTILVMLPLLENVFQFTSEMSSMILQLCILWDPVVSAMNVLGNSALVVLLARLWGRKTVAVERSAL